LRSFYYSPSFNGSEISHQKTKYTTQTSVLTKGVRLFIQNHLAEILYAETKGALPAEPNSLPKKKRRRDEDEEYERELGTRMSNLVEVVSSNFASDGVGVDESTCSS